MTLAAFLVLLSPAALLLPASDLWKEARTGGNVHGAAASLPVSRSDADVIPTVEGMTWLLRTDDIEADGRSLARSGNGVKELLRERSAVELDALKRCLTPLRESADRISAFQTHLQNLRTMMDTIDVRDPQQRLRLRQESLTGLYLQSLAGQIPNQKWQSFPLGRPQLILRPDSGLVDWRGGELNDGRDAFQRAWHGQSSLTRPDWMTPDREWAWSLLTDSAQWAAAPEGAYVWVVRDVFSIRLDATFVDAQDQFLGAAFISLPLTYDAPAGDPDEWKWLVPDGSEGSMPTLIGGPDVDFAERWQKFSARAEKSGFLSAWLPSDEERPYFAVWSPILASELLNRMASRRLAASEWRELLARHMEQQRWGRATYLRPRQAGFDETLLLPAAVESRFWREIADQRGKLVLANFRPMVAALPDRYFTHPLGNLILSGWRRMAGGDRLGYEMEFAGAMLPGPAGAAARHRLATLLRLGLRNPSGQSVLFAKVWPALSTDSGVIRFRDLEDTVFFPSEQQFRYLTLPMLFTDTPESQKLDVGVRLMHEIVVSFPQGVTFTVFLSDPARRTGESTTMGEARKRVPPGGKKV